MTPQPNDTETQETNVSGGTVEISVDLAPVVTSMSADDALVDLPQAEQDAADADLVVRLLKEHGSRVTALKEWDLMDDQEITINVTHTDAEGKKTRASW